jgi:hypothetical protein
LNWNLHACWAAAQLLEPLLQSFQLIFGQEKMFSKTCSVNTGCWKNKQARAHTEQ